MSQHCWWHALSPRRAWNVKQTKSTPFEDSGRATQPWPHRDGLVNYRAADQVRLRRAAEASVLSALSPARLAGHSWARLGMGAASLPDRPTVAAASRSAP